MDAPFHAGEIALQEATGVRARLAQAGLRVMRDFMPDQHRLFFAQLTFIVVGSLGDEGQPWAWVAEGPPGFVSSPDEVTLFVDAPSPPGVRPLEPGDPVGLLGIEPHTRRRNRANGRVLQAGAGGFTVAVEQSFGNCPKYIHEREPAFEAQRPLASRVRACATLDAQSRALVGRADTFFIASAHPKARNASAAAHGVDVSHRGGPPGFVRIEGEANLLVPDYVGNFYFNTLGNLALEPRCGLLFIDFRSGDWLMVAARAQLVTDGHEAAAFPGAQRLLRLQVLGVRHLPGVSRLTWREGVPSAA